MHTQKLQNRQPDALRGAGLVLLVALAAVAGSMFFSRLAPRLGALSSVLFIAYGCAIAWYLLDWYALSFIYTANDDCLRVCRAYGKRERFVADVWLNQVVAWGEPDDVKKRFPDARVTRATRSQCAFEPMALTYRQDGRVRTMIIQPDEAMRAHLLKALKARKS